MHCSWECRCSFHWDRQAFGYVPTIHYVLKFQWIHGIVQFTMCITSRCILHRVPNQHINRYINYNIHFVDVQNKHCRHKSVAYWLQRGLQTIHRSGRPPNMLHRSGRRPSMQCVYVAHKCEHIPNKQHVIRIGVHTRMILPQVHLRKPCYDFSFL